VPVLILKIKRCGEEGQKERVASIIPSPSSNSPAGREMPSL
jgi:hypothetical protein